MGGACADSASSFSGGQLGDTMQLLSQQDMLDSPTYPLNVIKNQSVC